MYKKVKRLISILLLKRIKKHNKFNSTELNATKFPLKKVLDSSLGEIVFPMGDNVMAPYIQTHGVWEENELHWLQDKIKPGFYCLNVGANVGYFAIWMSKLSGAKGKVIAVEPNPELTPILKLNLESKAISNFDIFPIAAGAKNETLKLFLNRFNYGDSRLFDPRITEGGGTYLVHGFDLVPKSCNVSVRRLDDLLDGAKIDVALLDTQGWDHQVLRGLADTILKWRPFVLTEFVPTWLINLGEDPIEILREYESWGYTLSSPEISCEYPLSPESIMLYFEKSDNYFINISLTPKLT